MKRLISFFTALILLLSLASCSASDTHTVVTIGDAEIPTDVFTYFLSEVIKDNPEITDKKELADAGCLKAAEYVAINTKFKEMKLSLTTAQKEEIASDVEGLWHTYSVYYKSIGVTRSVLTKIRTSEEYRKILLNALYGKGGEAEINDKKLKEYFYSNYIAFQAITGYLTETDAEGNTVKLSSDEVDKIKTEFSQMAKQISGGANINDVKKNYAKSHGYETSDAEITVYKKGGAFFPAKFFESAAALKYNKPGVIFSDEYIFLILLKDMSKDEKAYYQNYKNECLIALASEDFQSRISAQVNEYKIKTSNSVVDNCCNAVLRKGTSS